MTIYERDTGILPKIKYEKGFCGIAEIESNIIIPNIEHTMTDSNVVCALIIPHHSRKSVDTVPSEQNQN